MVKDSAAEIVRLQCSMTHGSAGRPFGNDKLGGEACIFVCVIGGFFAHARGVGSCMGLIAKVFVQFVDELILTVSVTVCHVATDSHFGLDVVGGFSCCCC